MMLISWNVNRKSSGRRCFGLGLTKIGIHSSLGCKIFLDIACLYGFLSLLVEKDEQPISVLWVLSAV